MLSCLPHGYLHVYIYAFGTLIYGALSLFLGGTSKAKEGLPQKCHLACFCALSQLEQVSRQLQGGDITVVDLQKIRSGQQQMERLCKAANSEQRKGDKSEQKGGQLSYDALIHSVELRLEEFNTLEKQQSFLQNLCEKIHPSIKG